MPVVDLTIDRNLLCPNFDGYKLSFDPVPVMRQNFDRNPLKLEAHTNQYSLLHVELFAKHNMLFSDPWARNTCYYINTAHQIILCSYDEQHGQPRTQRVVYTVQRGDRGDGYEHLIGDYNYTLRFISEKYCVLCDGMLTYYLLDTGDRLRATPWQQIASSPIANEDEYRAFALFDARLDIVQERKQISLVAGHVTRRPSNARHGADMHVMLLKWSRWTLDVGPDAVWTYNKCVQLETKGSLYYCAFEPRAESLVLCSAGEIETQEQREAAESDADATASAAESCGSTQNGHELPQELSWSQTMEHVLIRVPLPTDATYSDINISCNGNQLLIQFQSRSLLNAALYDSVELSTWSVETELHIKLVKKREQNWPRLLENEALPAPEEDARIELDSESESEERLPIPNLEDPLEDCDFPVDSTNDDIKIVRFNLPTLSVTHTIYLGASPPLFTSTLRAGFPTAFVTRQGVDASVWLQLYQPAKPDEWSVRHEGNLHAFGYVQASKQQRKFVDCCPELDYAVICESYRHVFIYKSRYDSAGGLRNRNGPQVVIGKQNLVTLDDDVGEVIGMTTSSNVITLLTEHAVLYIQI